MPPFRSTRFASPRAFTPVCLAVLTAAMGAFIRPARADDTETSAEKALGRILAPALESSQGVDDDPLLLDWVRAVGDRVAAQSPRKDLQPKFVIVASGTANALTLPGGTVLVTRGLLDTVESDDELASVLAHETGHVAKKHAVRQVEGTLIVNGLAYGLRQEGWPHAASALSLYNIFRALQKSREMEQQADDEGIRFAYEAGYDPDGLVRFLSHLGGGRPNALEQYLSTHPAPEERVERSRRDPLVTQTDPAVREAVAKGFADRGLPGLAAEVRRGNAEPLAAPEAPAAAAVAAADPEIARLRTDVAKRAADGRKGLAGAWRSRRIGGALQDILLFNSGGEDLGWYYLAARAYNVQDRVDDVYARAGRILRTAPPAFDRLLDSTPGPAGLEAAQGRTEVQQSIEHARAVSSPLKRAANAVAVVLVDLNNHYLRPRGNSAPWLRLLIDEATLRYAESELARASRYSDRGWRQLSLAQIRGCQARLNALVPLEDGPRRELWKDLATRRFGKPIGDVDGIPAGDATVRAALAVEMGKFPLEVDAGRGATPWADWTLKEKGMPENIATAMRLLTLDLERETAAEDRNAIGTE